MTRKKVIKMQILINLSNDEINTLNRIKEDIRDEHDLVFCIHELINKIENQTL